jgi:8-oxo-dGTP diphosphatase
VSEPDVDQTRPGRFNLDGLRIREAARALILDPEDRVLLVRFEFPGGTRWALPGGGLEPGETPLDAIRRELIEEVGLAEVEIGPHVWTRVHVIPFINGRFDGQREKIHLVRTPAFEPRPTLTWEQLNAEYMFELRWWTLPEIAASPVIFAPAALPEHLSEIVAGRLPIAPIDVGV